MIFKEHRHRLISPNIPIGINSHILEGTNAPIKNIGRVERIIKLIGYLQEYKSYKEIAEYLNISKRSANRYIHLLLELGFIIEREMTKYYRFRILNTTDVMKLS